MIIWLCRLIVYGFVAYLAIGGWRTVRRNSGGPVIPTITVTLVYSVLLLAMYEGGFR